VRKGGNRLGTRFLGRAYFIPGGRRDTEERGNWRKRDARLGTCYSWQGLFYDVIGLQEGGGLNLATLFLGSVKTVLPEGNSG
jgi:hypothetical protein